MKTAPHGIYRVIDANLNRSREGLRVCEEIARFILNSRTLTDELKSARHRIGAIKRDFPAGARALLGSRDTGSDPGRCERESLRMARKDCSDIFFANIERAKESLRVLEEFSKLIDITISRRFSRLRFTVYDIEKKSLKKVESLRDPR